MEYKYRNVLRRAFLGPETTPQTTSAQIAPVGYDAPGAAIAMRMHPEYFYNPPGPLRMPGEGPWGDLSAGRLGSGFKMQLFRISRQRVHREYLSLVLDFLIINIESHSTPV